jgi:hypothetical protein
MSPLQLIISCWLQKYELHPIDIFWHIEIRSPVLYNTLSSTSPGTEKKVLCLGKNLKWDKSKLADAIAVSRISVPLNTFCSFAHPLHWGAHHFLHCFGRTAPRRDRLYRVRVTVSCHLGQIPHADAMKTVPTRDSSSLQKDDVHLLHCIYLRF